MNYLLLFAAIMLFALTLRFVRPELIYSVRYYLNRVWATKILLDSEEGEEDRRAAFAQVMVNDQRYEVPRSDEEYVFESATRIRRLHHVLDLRRGRVEGLPDERKPQVCILELVSLLEKLAEVTTPDVQFDHPCVDAMQILTFIGNDVRKSKGLSRGMVGGNQTANWFIEYPISIEQVVELLIAAAHSLAYRRIAQRNESLSDRTISIDDVRKLVNKTRITVADVFRLCLERGSSEKEHTYTRLRQALGEDLYVTCSGRPSSNGTSLFEVLSLEELRLLASSEKQAIREVFGGGNWLDTRLAELVPFAMEASGGPFTPACDLLLARDYCYEIEGRIGVWRSRNNHPGHVVKSPDAR